MERLVHGVKVFGLEVGPKTECAHYRTPLDIVAIRFVCCGEYYSCISCHDALAGHEAQVRPRSRFEEPCVLCGACGYELTATEYLGCGHRCPHRNEPFNPGCASHAELYFELS